MMFSIENYYRSSIMSDDVSEVFFNTRDVRPHTAVRTVPTSVEPFFEDEVKKNWNGESGEQEKGEHFRF
jgi:hypothetical protein